MSARKKILFGLAGGTGIVLALLAAVFFLAPVYLNAPLTKAKLQAAASRTINGTVKFQRLDLSLLPRPHVVIHQPSLSVPGSVSGTLKSVSVYPRVATLLMGKVLISKIEFQMPDLAIVLPEATVAAGQASPTFAEVKEKIAPVLSSLQALGPGLVLEAEQGTLAFTQKGRPPLTLRSADALLTASPGETEVFFRATTDRWGAVALSGSLFLDEDKAEIKQLYGALGHSWLSGLSLRFTQATPVHLEVLSGTALLSLDELFPWLSSTESLAPFLKKVRSLKGMVSVSSMNFAGPLTQPARERMLVTGETQSVIVDSKLLPAPLAVSGGFSLDRDGIDLIRLSASAGKSSAADVSARFLWRMNQRIEVRSGRAAIDLDQVYQWRSSFSGLRDLLKNVTALKGTVTFSSVSFSGPIAHPETWKREMTGRAENIVVDSPLLPAPLAATGGFTAGRDSLELTGFSAALAGSSVSEVSARFGWGRRPSFEVRSGKAVIVLDEVYQWRSRYSGLNDVLKDVNALAGTARISSMRVAGSFSADGAWQITTAGSLENIFFDPTFLPGPLAVARGKFILARENLSLFDVHAALLDSSVALSGSLAGFPGNIGAVDLSLGGTMGQESLQWAFKTFALPSDLVVHTPLSFSKVHLLWKKPAELSLSGTVTVSDGPAISLDLYRSPEVLVVRRAVIKDQDSDATLSFRRQEKAAELSFSGTLVQATLKRIFVNRTFGQGKVTGKFHAAVAADQPLQFTGQGVFEGDGIVVPWDVTPLLNVDRFRLHADGNTLFVDSASMTWGSSHGTLQGTVRASGKGFTLDLALASDGINVNELEQAIRSAQEKKREEHNEEQAGTPAVHGTIRFASARLTYGRYTFSPVKAVVTVAPGTLSAAITEAKVCSVSIPGTLAVSHGDIQLMFKPTAVRQPLGPALTCLSGAQVDVTGTFDLNAVIAMSGKSGALLSSLEGGIDFKARDGKIYRYPVLAKIFSVLSVTEIFRGRAPQLGGSGFPYRSLVVKGDLHQGTFEVEKAYIGGSSLHLIGQGSVDIAGHKQDLVVLVAPFSTIDWFIRHIPLVNEIMGGTLISIPVKVSGDLSDPDVTFLAPSAVGSRILELIKNIVKLPVTIISPLLPREKEKKK